ncbi:MAG: hypoxanthine phosphoribosyltransferase [Candidatus Cryptobacteroides sp.]
MTEKIRLYDKTFKPFIPNSEIMEAIDKVAARLNDDYSGGNDVPVLLCVLNGSIMFTAELMKRLSFNLELVSIKLSSYEGTSSTGKVREAMGLTSDITGRRVIIVEDIVDTGNTINELKKIVLGHGASEAKVCTLLLKPDVYDKDTPLDYVAMEIPDRFIVGFGLDYNQLGRNIKDIYVLDTDNE